jgi:hypothetical protein
MCLKKKENTGMKKRSNNKRERITVACEDMLLSVWKDSSRTRKEKKKSSKESISPR